ncbi:dTMP kinase [bacterium]|nr:dTMP kinase [bacterium]
MSNKSASGLRSFFITVEGMEGAGKSTNISTMCEVMADRGVDFVVTREPGGTGIAEQIRQLLLAADEGESLVPTAELLLIFASRAQHIEHVIRPALARGQWVLCDRFTDATYAYQGGGRGMCNQSMATLEALVQQELQPDATIVLDVSVDVSKQRARARGELDRFERESDAFFERVREAYHQRVSSDAGRYHMIDATKTLDSVQTDVAAVMNALIDRAQGV